MKLRRSQATATQQTIADELGVSVMTVSRALRNHPGLAEETKNRVIAKAIDLGYSKIPNLGQAAPIKRVGLFLYEEPGKSIGFRAGIREQIFQAIQRQCQKYQVEMVLQLLEPGSTPVAIRNKTVDAICLMGRYTAEDALLFKGLPALAISSFTAESDLSLITADNIGGARQATQHLVDLGHQKILFIGDDESSFTELFRKRSEGYVLAMMQNGLSPQTIFIKSKEELLSAIHDIKKWTAIVCASDMSAIVVKTALTEAGTDVPSQVSIVGFDNIEESGAAKLTTYSPNWDQLGETAANIVIRFPELLARQTQILVPGTLIVRESTGRLRR